MSLVAKELKPGLGVKVEIELRKGLAEPERAELRRLFNTHGLLVVEVNDLTLDQQIDFCKTFGNVVPTSIDPKIETYVSNSRSDGYLGTWELAWHYDLCFLTEPFRACCLYAVDVQAGKSSTRFLSAVRGVDRLPEALRRKVQYLQVINTGETSQRVGTRVATAASNLAAAAHPILATHPVTGKRYITANPLQSDCIFGMTAAESAELLAEVYRYFHDERDVFEHFWKNGDLVIWDNLAVHHSRGEVSKVGNRTLRRLSVGPASYQEQIPERLFKEWLEISRSRQKVGAAHGDNPSNG